MELIRFGDIDNEKPGVLINGKRKDLSAHVADFDRAFFMSGGLIKLPTMDLAKESGMEPPAEPVVFFKAANTVVGPYDNIIIPRHSEKTDWEVELAVVIGKDARYLESESQSLEHIAGYCISHDVSERHFQL